VLFMAMSLDSARTHDTANVTGSMRLQGYLWIVVLHGIVAWLDAYGIGEVTAPR
jgi:hypothetical protein